MNPQHRRTPSSVFTLLILALAALPLIALQPPVDAPQIRAKEMRHQNLYIGNQYLPPHQVSSNSAFLDQLAELRVSSQAAFLDVRSGRWGTLMPKHPLLPGNGVGNRLTWQNLDAEAPSSYAEHQALVWDAFVSYLQANTSFLQMDVAELQSPGTVTIHNDGGLIQIHAKRFIQGVPVRDSYVTAVISHGNLTLFGARNWGDIDVTVQPSLARDAADGILADHLGAVFSSGTWRKAHLTVVPMARGLLPAQIAPGEGLDYRLVWVLSPDFPGQAGLWEAMIDAHSGELLAFQDTVNYAEETRTVVGGVFPVTNDGVATEGTEQADYPMPFSEVTVADTGKALVTDAGGNLLACVDGSINTALTGPYVRIVDTCGTVDESTPGSVLDFGVLAPPSADCDVAVGASAGNTHAARTGFYELNRMAEMARSHLPNNPWLNNPVLATVNRDLNCSATSGSTNGLRFSTSGGGCSNTGEIAAVFDHEWGHGMDRADAGPGISWPGEGIADIFASLRLNTSCIADNFFPGTVCPGFGDPCLSCTGVRDIDWAQRASGLPHDLAWIDANCEEGTGPCGGRIHCEGAVYAEAVWDLWNRDLVGGPFGMSLDTSREVATQLTFQGGGLVGSWYTCVAGTGTGDGCNADGGYLNYLAADDDNGDLSDGTPHMSAIAAAFSRHGIGCATPTVQDSGCVDRPTSAPTVTVTPLDRGAHITWTAVADATHYRIYRTDGVHGCDFGKTIVGETSHLELIDSGLMNGRETSYIVIAVAGAEACVGPASSCSQVTPVPNSNMAIVPTSFAITGLSGDLDPFLDNCERGRACFDVSNIGTGPLTHVELTRVTVLEGAVTVSSTFPSSSAASLGSCGIARTCFDLTADGLAQDDVLRFEVEATANELAEPRTAVVEIDFTESDFQSLASHTFSFEDGFEGWQVAMGTFDRSTGGPSNGAFMDSSDLMDNACDQILSPKMRLTETSTLSLETNFDIEGSFGSMWYDRANLALRDATDGFRRALDPEGGRLYNANGTFGGCLIDGENGWAGSMPSWTGSTWSSTVLGDFTGDVVNLDIVYSTDRGFALRGFWFDEVALTDFELQRPDAQSDVCSTVGSVPTALDDSAVLLGSAATVIDVLVNDSDADGDPLTVIGVTQGDQGTVNINGGGAGNTVIYTPDVGFNAGSDTFQYAVTDGNNMASVATVTVAFGVFFDGFETGDASQWNGCNPSCP